MFYFCLPFTTICTNLLQMTALNLAVVFAPTIMRPQTIEREMSDMQAQRVAVQTLLEMNKVIFGYET
jgi:Rho-type GTPase-activating protein 1/2